MKILVLHGPNLNLLGEREPGVYGKITLEELNRRIEEWSKALNIQVEIRQSNHEGELVTWIQESRVWASGIILNAGALTHYSYSLMDAVRAVKIPAIEVHLSHIYAREPYRRKSVIAEACVGMISGFGDIGYQLALQALKEMGLRRLQVV